MTHYTNTDLADAEIENNIDSLNLLLANLHIHYQKLRNFHWNVEGSDFFDLHAFFEEEYNTVKLQIDEIAERIRVFGNKPISTLQGYLEVSSIKEAGTEYQANKMVELIIDDFHALQDSMIKVHENAGSVGDIATQDMMTKYIKRIELRQWMLKSFIK